MPSLRTSLATTTALFLSLSPTVLADDYTLTPKMSDVVVYMKGASVSKTANLALSKGNHTITIENIPGSSDERLITAQIKNAGITLLEQTIDRVFTNSASSVQAQALEKQINTLKDTESLNQDQQSVIQMQLDFLKRLSNPNAGQNNTSLSMDNWQESIKTLGGNAASLLKQKRDLLKEQATIQQEIATLQKELNALRNKRDYTYSLRMAVYADKPVTADVALTYIVKNAGWSVEYRADLDTEKSMVDLSSKAVIRQESGEDWRDINVTLSTEQPDFWGARIEAPTLSPDFIDFEKFEIVTAAPVIMKDRLKESIMDMTMNSNPVVAKNNFAATRISLGRNITVQSNNEAQSHPLEVWSKSAALKALAVPQSHEKAYLYASFKHEDKTPLFGGSVQLFRDGMYVGKNYFNTVLTDETANIAFGIDPNITVKFYDKGDVKSEKGIFNKDTEQRFIYDLYVKNAHTVPITVEVRDQLPVSKDDKITVETIRGATPATTKNVDNIPGVLAWIKQMPSESEWTIKHHYQVIYPKGREIE